MGSLKREFRCLIIVCCFINYSCTSTILFYMGIASLGHRIATWPMVTELIRRGHNVSFVSMHPGEIVSHPNVKEVPIKAAIQNFGSSVCKDPLELRQQNLHQVYFDLMPIDALLACEAIIKDKNTLNWIKSSRYDLVILDSLHNDCGLGLAHIFGAKIILLGSSSLFMWNPDAFGLPAETSWIPDIQRHFPLEMTYMQRLRNTIRAVRWHIFRESYLFPQLEQLFKTYLEEYDLPCISDIEKSISLILVNSHFSNEFARNVPPSVVPVGGMHILESNMNLLPKVIYKFKDISNFIGETEFIYVSFGRTNISRLDPIVKTVLMTTLSGLNIRVIMKLNENDLSDLPTNIYTKSWLPQQNILAHSQIRGFISDGGSHSVQEAIYHAVPLIVLPVFGDQDYNAERIHRLGYGIRLEIINLTHERFHQAIDQLLHNKTILDNMKNLSEKFKDRPMKPLDLALWWTEYVLRHNDTESLIPFAINQTWFQRRLLDVWFPIFLLGLISILTIIYFIKFTISSFISAIEDYFVKHTETNTKSD